jgi:hypothetical protein
MPFIFSSEIQTGLASGQYEEVFFKNGTPMGRIRDAVTGEFVKGSPIGAVNDLGAPLQPFLFPSILPGQNPSDLMPMFNSLSQSVSLLQTTTAIIGVGTAATVALSAVNLWQTIRLRQEIATLRTDMVDGFLDLQEALRSQGVELLEHINQIATDVEFQQHRTILSRAYGQFATAVQRLQLVASIQDPQQRNHEITMIRAAIAAALADYENPQILMGLSAPAYLRRRECVWLIDQILIMTYQLQGETATVTQYLNRLRLKLQQDLLQVIELITTQTELDFLFPEIFRIYHHDLPTLDLWLAYTAWRQELSSTPSPQLPFAEPQLQQITDDHSQHEVSEALFYQQMRATSHFSALKDQLRLLLDPDLRQQYQEFIIHHAVEKGWTAITLDNLRSASCLTIANLYHYFHAGQVAQSSNLTPM